MGVNILFSHFILFDPKICKMPELSLMHFRILETV